MTTYKNYKSTPIRVAILVDGGYFIKRYNTLYDKERTKTPEEIAADLYTICHGHVGNNNYLYRIFYYDCVPFAKCEHNPVNHKCIDYSKTDEAKRRMGIIDALKRRRKVALRLGTIKEGKGWMLYPSKVKELINGTLAVSDLSPDDVYFDMQQKGIDMKIGVDIASISLKHFVDKIVLVSGDSDFVPAAKLARREGIDFVLDAMHSTHIESSLYEHIDGLESINLRKKKA